MKENLKFKTEKAKVLYEKSLTDPELTEELLQANFERGNMELAMVFAENLCEQLPDEYFPVHNKIAILMQKKETGDVGILLAQSEEKFGDDPEYIMDRLTYTINILGTGAARKYLDKIQDKPAYESERFLELCARIFYGEGEEKPYIEVLFYLHEKYHSERARFLLALKSMEYQKWEPALKWFVQVINGFSGSGEYFISLAGRCLMLRQLERDNWREETEMAAREIDAAAVAHPFNMWLRGFSAELWKMLGNTEKEEQCRIFMADLEEYITDPDKFMREHKVKNGENPDK